MEKRAADSDEAGLPGRSLAGFVVLPVETHGQRVKAKLGQALLSLGLAEAGAIVELRAGA